jgi:hypothetical protein
MSKELYMYDFGGGCDQTYSERCSDCGRIHEVSTQRDQNPEYYTDIFVRCTCGGSVEFNLPVN